MREAIRILKVLEVESMDPRAAWGSRLEWYLIGNGREWRVSAARFTAAVSGMLRRIESDQTKTEGERQKAWEEGGRIRGALRRWPGGPFTGNLRAA